MANPRALLLLLAVAASQVDLSLSQSLNASVEVDISNCSISFYGRTYSVIEVSKNLTNRAICFKHNSSDIAQDCLWTYNIDQTDRITVQILNESAPVDLPNFKSNTSKCHVSIVFKANETDYVSVSLYNVGAQTAVKFSAKEGFKNSSVVMETKNGNTTLSRQSVPTVSAVNVDWDISGCRVADVAHVANSTIRLVAENCTAHVCDVSADIQTVSTCGSKICLGNNTCAKPPAVCTVTGSTVIDFSSSIHSVPDRCVYSLMKPQGSSAYNILAGFLERRRQDVVFLDHLILSLNGSSVKIFLEQGGRVRVDNQKLTLNTTGQLVHGVELSKNQTVVTAKIPFANLTVFFDGNTAHVAGDIQAVEGLCGNPTNSSENSTLSAAKSSTYSVAGCEIHHNDTTNSTINCNRTTEHCNLMKQAPFTACHSHADPEPFITACINTLCKYPAVDGVGCQFFEAYAKSCSLKQYITWEDWRSNTNCSAAPPCQDQYCSAHEFCGEQHGESRCFCRAIFASKYRSTDTLGEPTVCTQNSATLILAGCLMEEKNIDYSTLHLRDQNCTGRINNETHMVTFSFDSVNTCGTEVLNNNSQVIYQNTVMLRNISDIITRYDQVNIDFSCYYTKPEVKSVSFKIKDSSVVTQIVSGIWNYTVMMNTYTDSSRMHLVKSDTEVALNQKIWVELKTAGLDAKMVAVVTDSCWASNSPAPNATVRYDLIKNKCPNPVDQTVKVEGNGNGLSNFFSFNMFQFSGGNDQVYLHCKLELCLIQGNNCTVSCSGGGSRKRRSSRSKYAEENQALITMTWSN